MTARNGAASKKMLTEVVSALKEKGKWELKAWPPIPPLRPPGHPSYARETIEFELTGLPSLQLMVSKAVNHLWLRMSGVGWPMGWRIWLAMVLRLSWFWWLRWILSSSMMPPPRVWAAGKAWCHEFSTLSGQKHSKEQEAPVPGAFLDDVTVARRLPSHWVGLEQWSQAEDHQQLAGVLKDSGNWHDWCRFYGKASTAVANGNSDQGPPCVHGIKISPCLDSREMTCSRLFGQLSFCWVWWNT